MEDPVTWDGAAGWPRPRADMGARIAGGLAPSCFVQADPADPLSAETARLQQCYDQLLCQVCGEPALDVDAVGWVLEPAANMGGACCTRCMYLAARVCPHLAGLAEGSHALWTVVEPCDYRWCRAEDGSAKGHVVPDPQRARRSTWSELIERRSALRS